MRLRRLWGGRNPDNDLPHEEVVEEIERHDPILGDFKELINRLQAKQLESGDPITSRVRGRYRNGPEVRE
jgi:hypothetical protein